MELKQVLKEYLAIASSKYGKHHDITLIGDAYYKNNPNHPRRYEAPAVKWDGGNVISLGYMQWDFPAGVDESDMSLMPWDDHYEFAADYTITIGNNDYDDSIIMEWVECCSGC